MPDYEPDQILPGLMSEREFQRLVSDYARLRKWRVAHFPKVTMLRRGGKVHMTAVAYDGKGFPDLVLSRGGVVIFAELKSEGGRVDIEQARWIESLGLARGDNLSVVVWRPSMWPEIERALR